MPTPRLQAAAQPFYPDRLWQEMKSQPPLFKQPFLPAIQISGCSFRFYCAFTLQTCFFSGRDRAGEEKEAG
ncbi:MAG: hypothetical protein D3923_08360, partial [Candidatus Electrothrix sp. AR3]|nr:hypothetical protein [Candidatus Electrothrix sp. AR3]